MEVKKLFGTGSVLESFSEFQWWKKILVFVKKPNFGRHAFQIVVKTVNFGFLSAFASVPREILKSHFFCAIIKRLFFVS